MRAEKITIGGVSVRAISGTYVVFLAFDLLPAARKGCLGFAIKRHDKIEGEVYWLDGYKTFEGVGEVPGPGVRVSTLRHPVQGFQWADYTAKPGYDYEYEVIPMYGKPAALKQGTVVKVAVTTEKADVGTHQVHFNRGAVASQEYARRFQNTKPSNVEDGSAYRWLGRGLEEALVSFVGRAKGKGYSLRAAVYEFQWAPVLDAFAAAANRGANVKIVYDAIPKEKGPAKKNAAAIKKAGLTAKCIKRTRGTIMHNKFIVLLKEDNPIAVWTGSTNITENGIFGHLNVGHTVNVPAVAKRYFEYWTFLSKDPTTAELKDWADEHDELPVPDSAASEGTKVIFSPHRGLEALKWVGSLARRDNLPVFITLAFGMNKVLQEVYRQNDEILRVALLEKPGNGSGMAQGRIDIQAIRNRPNVLVAMGHYVMANKFDRWLREIDRIKGNVNVRWVHTKFLLVDPLGTDPVVVTGSANFSDAGTHTNDENMLIVCGDTRVADIYFTEYLRIYSHHAFRESLSFNRNKNFESKHLEKTQAWQKPYFTAGNESYLRRLYYIGK